MLIAHERFISADLNIDFEKTKLALVFGSERGNVIDARNRLIQKIKKIHDDVDIVRITKQDIKSDSKIIKSELMSSNLFGSKKIVEIDGADEKILQDIEHIKGNDIGNYLILLGESFTKTSKIRRFFDTNTHCLSVSCYDLSGKYVDQYIAQQFKKNGVIIDNLTISDLSFVFGGDINNINNELQKIILYSVDRESITSDEMFTILSPQEEKDYLKLINLILDSKKIEQIKLSNAISNSGIHPILILRMMYDYLLKIKLSKIAINHQSSSIDLEAKKNRILFWQLGSFKKHIQNSSFVLLDKILNVITTTCNDIKEYGDELSNEIFVNAILKIN